jgi:16S rRNA (cytosine1402-N4)-methyltransferase
VTHSVTAIESQLVEIISKYGEEQNAEVIAKAIIQRRKQKPILSSKELADIVRSVSRTVGKDSATKTFQGLRIFVNNEVLLTMVMC